MINKHNLITAGIMVLVATVFFLVGGLYSDNTVINNEDVLVEYISNNDGTYEVYVDIKDGKVSEVSGNNELNSFLIAPDME